MLHIEIIETLSVYKQDAKGKSKQTKCRGIPSVILRGRRYTKIFSVTTFVMNETFNFLQKVLVLHNVVNGDSVR